MKRQFLLFSIVVVSSFSFCFGMSEEARAKGFVYVHEVDPTIQISMRYCGNENFLGERVDGYKKAVLMLTRLAAEALKEVQEDVKKDGYCLVVYDAYRPQQAVDHFVRWASAAQDQRKKSSYYPSVNKKDVFDLDYVAKRSGHSRGSTVDLTIIEAPHVVHPVNVDERMLLDGRMIKFLDDGTVDMGSSFDLFDEASHAESKLVAQDFQKRRAYLRSVMEKHGFKNLYSEWWHFTLKNEPHPKDQDSSYFNFPVS